MAIDQDVTTQTTRSKQQNLQPTVIFKYRSLIPTDAIDSVCKTIVTHPVKLF